MKRKVDMIENEIWSVRDNLEEELYGVDRYSPDYDILLAKIRLCEQFLGYISNLGKRSR